MKKLITVSIMAILCSVLSAQVFTSISTHYDCAYEFKSEGEITKTELQTQFIPKLSAYWFPDNSLFGVFSYIGGRILPLVSAGGTDKEVDKSFVLFSPCMGIGAGFRYPVTQKIMLKTGVAASINFQISQFQTFRTEHYRDEIKTNTFIATFGITDDIGGTYILSKNVYIDFGAVLGFWYANYTYRTTTDIYLLSNYANNWDKNYFKISLTPFIGFGLKLPV